MQSRFYCPSFAYCRFSLRGCRKGPPPLPLSSAGGGVYPARRQFVSRLRSMPSALPIYRRRFSSSGMPEGAAAPSAGVGVYPVRRQCVPRLRSIPSALPIYHRRSSSSGDAGRGRRPLPLSSAGGGVYPVRRQFISRLRSMLSALPIYRRCPSSSGDAGRGRRPFRSLPQAGACTPPRSDFLFVRTQRLAVLFHFIRSENLCRRKIASDS